MESIISVKGMLYGGQNTGRQSSVLIVDAQQQVRIDGTDFEPCGVSDLHIASRVGNTARMIRLPNNMQFESSENDAIDRIVALSKASHSVFNIHLLESKLSYIVLSLVLFVAVTYGAVTVGIPAASNALAKSLPASVSALLGDGALDQLDEYLKPSQLDKERQQYYTDLFSSIAPQSDTFQFRLNFRKGGLLGANAFALPNGDIIVTDEFIELAEKDEEVLAVLYHEIGHVLERHSLRQLMEATGTTILLAWILEDVEGVANIVLSAPLFFIQSSYSRSHETEADTFALEKMLAADIDPIYFSSIMGKLSNQRSSIKISGKTENPQAEPEPDQNQNDESRVESKEEHKIELKNEPKEQLNQQPEADVHSESTEAESEKSIWYYLSSHPASEDRMKRFKQASEQWNQSKR